MDVPVARACGMSKLIVDRPNYVVAAGIAQLV